MATDDLIARLAGEPGRRAVALPVAWTFGLAAATGLAALAFFATIGPRPDIALAATTPRFLFKFVVAFALTATALFLAVSMARPGDAWRRRARGLAVAPLLLAAAVLVELFLLPEDAWAMSAVGKNYLVCLFYLPLIGLGPLAAFLAALRHGAPTRPALSGAVAGILAGGLAALFYAAHCTDDSPLFVAIWYSIAIAILGVLGALAARLVVRW